MSVDTQIRTLQKAMDDLVNAMQKISDHQQAQWTSYGQLKARIVRIENQVTSGSNKIDKPENNWG